MWITATSTFWKVDCMELHKGLKMRHLVENAFLRIKEWKGIATRYAKNTASYLAAVKIRCLFLWLTIS